MATPTNPPTQSASQTLSSFIQQPPNPTASPPELAGLFRRWAAAFIDLVFVGAIGLAISIPLLFIAFSLRLIDLNTATMSIFAQTLISLFGWVYYIYNTGRSGQTPGKWIMKIKVKRTDDPSLNIGYTKAFLREVVGKFLSGLVLGLGFAWMIWDKEKQTWHDKIAGTIVVKIKDK